jgi:hypothetical protein
MKSVAVCTWLVCSACASRSPAGADFPRPPTVPAGTVISLDEIVPLVVPGEAISWELTYRGVRGGRARLVVGEPQRVGERNVVAMRAQAETLGIAAAVKQIRDEVSSWVDADDGAPLHTESEALISGRWQAVDTIWTPGEAKVDLVIRADRGEPKKRSRVLPSARTHDPLSALLMIRGWQAPDGARATFYTLGGQRLWRTDLTVEGREAIDCTLGTHRAIKLSGVSTRMTPALTDDNSRKPRTFTVWLSDDASRIPLRVVAHTELGDVMVEATEYFAP